jgi:hypothetical protein
VEDIERGELLGGSSPLEGLLPGDVTVLIFYHSFSPCSPLSLTAISRRSP